MNCVLQCFLHAPCLWHYLRQKPHAAAICTAEDGCELCDLEELAEAYATLDALGAAPRNRYAPAATHRYLTPRALVRRTAASGVFSYGDMHDSVRAAQRMP